MFDLCHSVDCLPSFSRFLECVMFSVTFVAIYKGSLTMMHYPKLYIMALLLSYERFLFS